MDCYSMADVSDRPSAHGRLAVPRAPEADVGLRGETFHPGVVRGVPDDRAQLQKRVAVRQVTILSRWPSARLSRAQGAVKHYRSDDRSTIPTTTHSRAVSRQEGIR